MNNFDKIYGLLGRSLGHSFSKDYFTKKFSELNLNYSYQNIEIDNVSDIIPFVRDNENLKGFNVTVPYKEEIIPYLDSLDDTAKNVGAVNTVKIEDGLLKGFNTDVIGFEILLEMAIRQQDCNIANKSALIFGSGGASKAVQYVLNKKNIPYKIVSRNVSKSGIGYEEVNNIGFAPYSLLINTTPVGMFPNVNECLKLPYSTIESPHIFIDLIYNPEESLFLKKARLKGAATYNGLIMLHEQAEAAWNIWDN